MNVTPAKLALVEKILNAKLTASELKAVTQKASEMLLRRNNK